ncbi:probable disease resistance protein At5g66900 [Prosopis cineraria]|uniref:probable disease resistance protein At5g66900 n=1 Tax=Prosopis cineraria TaxID=364024 RepID=UPI00241040E7|nr:probable disease resistance protein At5g66900 [Prosopis cineraria]
MAAPPPPMTFPCTFPLHELHKGSTCFGHQVVRSCGGFPLATKVIGGELKGRHPDIWRKKSKESSQSADYSPSGALTYLHNDFEAVREFFMDLGSFPKNQVIPVTALSDMWAELYQDDDDGIEVMSHIRQLAHMNLVDKVVQRRIGSDEDNSHNNHILTQHKLLRVGQQIFKGGRSIREEKANSWE